MSKPSIPQGTRDFAPVEVRKRQYIFGVLKSIFELYGFQPLETPAMENLTTLTGKYGEEGDRLIFKILNNGLHEQTPEKKAKFKEETEKILEKSYSTPAVTERALRYDLTIPFARFVAMHQNDLAFPFRRYQMQPVWRADRPQKGRYREFWQCDADIVGTTSLLCEAELLAIYATAFHQLKIPVSIKINSRKILAGIAAYCGAPERLTDITIAIDKYDKVGREGVEKELTERGFEREQIERILRLSFIGNNSEVATDADPIAAIEQEFLEHSVESGLAGIREINTTLSYFKALTGSSASVAIDFSLARGLNYYTGIIAEVVCTLPDVKMGSIGGGGRYDDLTGLFGVKGLSGVGVSFGIDRIYDVMDELQLFPEQIYTGTKVLIVNFGDAAESFSVVLLQQLRSHGIATELYPDAAKFDKQMKYADKRKVPFVIIPGSSELAEGKISLKNMVTGLQQTITVAEAITIIL
jgi:histidyl-tRNA synthetase